MNILIGIDPGDRWTGVATMIEYEGSLILQSACYSSGNGVHRPAFILQDFLRKGLMYQNFSGRVVAEEYAVRPVGHQRFTRSEALRLLGALEFVSEEAPQCRWGTIPPGKAKPDLKRLQFDQFLKRWMKDWEKPKDKRWGHALSAWRVLGLDLLRNPDRKNLLGVLRGSPRRRKVIGTVPILLPTPVDLVTPAIAFRIPR